jgi:hypothetical protein
VKKFGLPIQSLHILIQILNKESRPGLHLMPITKRSFISIGPGEWLPTS